MNIASANRLLGKNYKFSLSFQIWCLFSLLQTVGKCMKTQHFQVKHILVSFPWPTEACTDIPKNGSISHGVTVWRHRNSSKIEHMRWKSTTLCTTCFEDSHKIVQPSQPLILEGHHHFRKEFHSHCSSHSSLCSYLSPELPPIIFLSCLCGFEYAQMEAHNVWSFIFVFFI